MSCILSIIGKDLDIDAFILESKLKGFVKRYKGDIIGVKKPTNLRRLAYSYISTSTSKADFYDLPKQIDDTIKYLKRNKNKLKRIASTKEIEYATLNFGVNSSIDNKINLAQSLLLPFELLNLCSDLKLSIELSIYAKQTDLILQRRNKRSKK